MKTQFKGKRIFITGANGGIGGDLSEYLTEKGAIIMSSDTDILDVENFNAEIQTLHPDIVIHLAAMCGTKDCEEVPNQAIRVNVEGTYNVVAAAKKVGAKFVYFSTTAIIRPGIEPIREDSPIDPHTIYGKTKSWGEEVARYYIPKNDLIVVRPCFGFGGRTDVSMLGALIRSHYNKKYINLLLSPENKKDYAHVRNFSHAIYLMLEKEAWGETYNISYGSAIPYKEIIQKLWKHGIYPKFKMFPEGDYMGNHCVSNEKICKELGYKNLISLDEGIDMVVKQYKKK
ncbi:MAG: NAD-dependent epimerase/dehydratase family protein [Nitrospiria bacterium]